MELYYCLEKYLVSSKSAVDSALPCSCNLRPPPLPAKSRFPSAQWVLLVSVLCFRIYPAVEQHGNDRCTIIVDRERTARGALCHGPCPLPAPYPCLHSHQQMSSTVPTVSVSNFRLIVDAFDDYANRVGEDLTKNPLADLLRTCDTPNAVLRLLQEREQAFKHFRDGDQTLIEWLKPVVHVVHGFSNVLGQIASMVSGAPCFNSLVTFSNRLLLATFPPPSAIFVSIDVLFTVRILSISNFIFLISGQIRRPVVSARATNSLVDLFESSNALKSTPRSRLLL